MSVVSRMVVTEVAANVGFTKLTLTAQYVSDPNDPHIEEIRSFFEATPYGKLEANIKNALAAEQFQPGQAYYLSLDRIPEPGEADAGSD